MGEETPEGYAYSVTSVSENINNSIGAIFQG
jgi:hypothetical protein